MSEVNSLVFIRPHTVGWGGFSSTDICQKLTYINPSFVTIYLSEVDPFILLQPYIWLKSTFFYSMAIYFYSMAIYLAEVNPFIFLRPYIWRRCWSFPIGNLSPLPLHCSMLTLMADWWWSLTTGHDDDDEKKEEVIGTHSQRRSNLTLV